MKSCFSSPLSGAGFACLMGLFVFSLFIDKAVAHQQEKNLLFHDGFDIVGRWKPFQTEDTGITFAFEQALGAQKKGCLHIANSNPEDKTPRCWYGQVNLIKSSFRRLRLTAKIRSQDFKAASSAHIRILIKSSDKDPVAADSQRIQQDSDWQEVKTIFEIPENAKSLLIMPMLTGSGKVWFDDLVLEFTDEEITKTPDLKIRTQPSPKALTHQPSLLDENLISMDIKKWEKPHPSDSVRSWVEPSGRFVIENTNEEDSQWRYFSFTLDAPEEKPYRLAFSAQVKAEGFTETSGACVFIRRLSPSNEQNLKGVFSNRVEEDSDWRKVGAVFEVPPSVHKIQVWLLLEGKGTVRFGELSLVHTKAPATPLYQPRKNPLPEGKTKRLARRNAEEIPWVFDVKTARELAQRENKPLLLYVRCVSSGADLVSARKSIDAKRVPFGDNGYQKDLLFRSGPLADPDVAQLITRRFVPLCLTYDFDLHGKGRGAEDPLKAFELSAPEMVTPALVAIGEFRVKLHRIGALSTDFLDCWLRDALLQLGFRSQAKNLEDLYLDGELDQVLKNAKSKLLCAKALTRQGKLEQAKAVLKEIRSPQALFQLGKIFMRQGAWADALNAFKQIPQPQEEESRFWMAWCVQRLGGRMEAMDIWKEMVSETRYGKKAAACLLPQGPRPWLAQTERCWPRAKTIVQETEGNTAFNPNASIRALLELQNPDGSFTSHRGLEIVSASGPVIYDPYRIAITALAAEALYCWRDQVSEDVALNRASGFIIKWAQKGCENCPASFNGAYALMHLTRIKEIQPAKQVIDFMAKNQFPDGNWSSYGPHRPASFDTALNILALIKAKEAGINLPKGLLERAVRALEAMGQKSGLFPYSTAPGHQWMTTQYGSIARDPLCEHALLLAGKGSREALGKALDRFLEHHKELRTPTKQYFNDFNPRGHGSYFFFFALKNAFDAAAHAEHRCSKKTRETIRNAVLAAQEGDGSFMDDFMYGRAYGTAMALCILCNEW